jgi:RNA polymerase sigma-70 factor, ECF subfamily
MNGMLETALIEALKDDDWRVYQSIQEKYQHMVYLIINGYVRNSQQAKDLTQEIFTALWIKRKKLNTDKPIRSYLATMAHHKCIDLKRSLKVKRKFIAEYVNGFRGSNQTNESFEEQEQLSALVDLAINFITARRCREIVYMSVIDMKSNKEIAATLCIQPQVVRNQLCAGMKIVREKLHELLNP